MWRRATIANNEALANTQVWEYRLPRSGILNAALLHLEATNGGTSNISNQLWQCVNRIQILDGARVIADMSGVQSQVVSLWATKGEPHSQWLEGAGAVQTFDAFIPLGLKKYDNNVGLDLSILKNPVIRVDIDLTTIRAVGAAGYLTGSLNLSAVLLINDGADQPSPGGFLKTHELDSWTTAAAGIQTTQGPVDAPWARLFIRSHLVNTLANTIITQVRLSFDSGQFVPIDEDTLWQANAIPLMLGRHPRFEACLFGQDADTWDTFHGQLSGVIGQNGVDVNHMHFIPFVTGQLTLMLNVASTGAAVAVDEDVHGHWSTIYPFSTVTWDFADMGFLEAQQYDRADVQSTQGVAAAAAQIWCQQIMPNATA